MTDNPKHTDRCKNLHKRVGACICALVEKDHETIGQIREKAIYWHTKLKHLPEDIS